LIWPRCFIKEDWGDDIRFVKELRPESWSAVNC
jgi:hypothetical protein